MERTMEFSLECRYVCSTLSTTIRELERRKGHLIYVGASASTRLVMPRMCPPVPPDVNESRWTTVETKTRGALQLRGFEDFLVRPKTRSW